MMSFADIHTHFIPGVDDGASSLDETIEMLRLAYNSGTRSMVATPHMFLDMFPGNSKVAINDRFAATIAELRQRSEQPDCAFIREMELTLGAEHYGSAEFVQALHEACVLPINGSRYLLVEFSPFLPWGMLEVVINRVLQSGYFPVVAHTERITGIQDKPSRAENLVRIGCVIQVNAESFLDGAEGKVRKTAHTLAREELMHVVASDGHRPKRRPPLLLEASQRLLQKYSPEQVEAWLWHNPRSIIKNESVDTF